MTPPVRLAYLVSHPIQYQAPLLRRIAASPDIDLTVFFLSDFSVRSYRDPGFGTTVEWDIPLLEGYRHYFLPTIGDRDRLSFWKPVVYGLWSHLLKGDFDAIWLNGYAHYSALIAIASAKAMGTKVLMRGDSNLASGTRSPVIALIKELVLRVLFSRVDGFLVSGTLNREYYRHYGAPEHKLFLMPFAVDNDFFQSRCAEARPLREMLRSELGLNAGRPIILFASKLLPRKRAGDLLEAYALLSADGKSEPEPYLLFVGDGEERPKLERRAEQHGWSSIRFLGFKNQTELPRYFDLCDVFVLPSEGEPWGLVVNEVMNAARPVIVSDQVGAGPDLVCEGETGFVVPVGDIRALSDRLRWMTADPGRARRMGENALRLIQGWGLTQDVLALRAALDTLVGQRERLRA